MKDDVWVFFAFTTSYAAVFDGSKLSDLSSQAPGASRLERLMELQKLGRCLFLLFILVAVAGRVDVHGAQRRAPSEEAPEATVILNEQFFNSLLDAIFTQLRPPSFPLNVVKQQGGEPRIMTVAFPGVLPAECPNLIELKKEAGGVKTRVSFANGKISAPLAFSGTYSIALLGCMRFEGWANTELTLYFDQARQTLSGRLNVEDIQLTGVPSFAGGVLVPLVQSSIDNRINPVQILQATQLTAKLPISASGGSLQMRAQKVTPEIVQGELRLHIVYAFTRD
jgi:hypothetical protein